MASPCSEARRSHRQIWESYFRLPTDHILLLRQRPTHIFQTVFLHYARLYPVFAQYMFSYALFRHLVPRNGLWPRRQRFYSFRYCAWLSSCPSFSIVTTKVNSDKKKLPIFSMISRIKQVTTGEGSYWFDEMTKKTFTWTFRWNPQYTNYIRHDSENI